MLYGKWNARGASVAAAVMLLGCGGDSELYDPTLEAHLIAAPESAAAVAAQAAELPAPHLEIFSAAPVITREPMATEAPAPAGKTAQTPVAAPAASAPLSAAQIAPARVTAIRTPPIPTVAAIPTPASPFTPPIPAIPAISIPAIPSVAAIAPSSPASALTPTSSNQAAGSGPAPADDFSGKKMIGFANLGQTCYANAALKLLIHSIGPAAMISHLENISASFPPEKIESLQEFVNLIRTAHTPQQSTAGVMKRFFTTLDKTNHFYLGKIIGTAQGTSYFYDAMHRLFEIEKINNGDLSLTRESIRADGSKKVEQQSDILHILLPDADDMDLQALVNTYSRKTDASSTQRYQFQTSDEKAVQTVNFMVGPGVGSKTDQLNFNDTVTIPVVNRISGKKFTATLKAKAIVFPKSSQPGVTHYVSYLKYDGKGFSLHNDWSVADGIEIQENNYPELISFSVVKMESN